MAVAVGLIGRSRGGAALRAPHTTKKAAFDERDAALLRVGKKIPLLKTETAQPEG